MKFPSKEFIEEFKKTPGAISVCEAIAITWLGSQVQHGTCIDVGSNAGKAAMSAAHGIQEGVLHLVDPIYDMENREAFKHSLQGSPENVPWGYAFDPKFREIVEDRIKSVSGMTPDLIGDYSLSALDKYDSYGYVFLDSDDHQPELVLAEVKLLEDKMVLGGIIAFHDFRNQYHGPHEAYLYLLDTGKYESIDIPWDEIRQYVSENNLETGNESWHMPGIDLPCFVGAVRRSYAKA
jgi:hypothetical protein